MCFSLKREEDPMLKIAHRGYSGLLKGKVENTILSFERALWAGADAIELDVRRTRDRELVVVHDMSLQRVAGVSVKVSELTYEQILQYDVGLGHHAYVPRLEFILAHFYTSGCRFLIELKQSGIAQDLPGMFQFFSSRGMELKNRVIIYAFDHDDRSEDSTSSWEELLKAWPLNIALAATYYPKISRVGWEPFLKTAVSMGAIAVTPCNGVTKTIVDMAHELGIMVYPWTVNNPKGIRNMKNCGVDGIISDFPNLL